jgi:hypothetical protein
MAEEAETVQKRISKLFDFKEEYGPLGCDAVWVLLESAFQGIFSTLKMEATCFFETSNLARSHGVTPKKMTFFIVAAVKTSNLA